MNKIQEKRVNKAQKIQTSGFLLFEFIITLSLLMIFVLAILKSLNQLEEYSLQIKALYKQLYAMQTNNYNATLHEKLERDIAKTLYTGSQ